MKNVIFVKIDYDQSPELVRKYNIRTLPTFIYREQKLITGNTASLQNWIEKMIQMPKKSKNPPVLTGKRIFSTYNYRVIQTPFRNSFECVGSS